MINKQEYNRLAAELCDVDECLVTKDGLIPVRSGTREPFNPYDDANDMLLLEEKLKMYTLPPLREDKEWRASDADGQVVARGKTPHESRRACAEEYLKEWKK